MAEVKWIKITTDIFDDEKILLIESLPDAYAIITVWFKLLCLAGKQNNSGVFLLGRLPYTNNMLATIFRMKEATVTMALQTFETFGMIEIVDGVITIPNWEKHQSLDKFEIAREQTRQRVAKHREKQKQLAESNVTCNVTVTESNADRIEEDKDKDKDKDKEKEVLPKGNTKQKTVKQKYGEYQNVLLTDTEYTELAKSYGIELREKAITFLDEYIEEKGYKSKSHNLAIKRWVIEAVSKSKDKPKATRKSDVEEWFEERLRQSYDEPPLTAADDPELRKRGELLKEELRKG